MKIPAEMPRLKGYRFPREVVAYAVWVYHRFALSTAEVGKTWGFKLSSWCLRLSSARRGQRLVRLPRCVHLLVTTACVCAYPCAHFQCHRRSLRPETLKSASPGDIAIHNL